jgi:hypothetical protein
MWKNNLYLARRWFMLPRLYPISKWPDKAFHLRVLMGISYDVMGFQPFEGTFSGRLRPRNAFRDSPVVIVHPETPDGNQLS